MKTTDLLTLDNKLIDMPGLNRFRIGDHVVAEACADHDRFEGVVIGIELHRVYASAYLKPSITILHDGDQITDGFGADDLTISPTSVAPQPWKERETFAFDLDDEMVQRMDALAERCDKQGIGLLASANYHGQGLVQVPSKWLRLLIAGYKPITVDT